MIVNDATALVNVKDVYHSYITLLASIISKLTAYRKLPWIFHQKILVNAQTVDLFKLAKLLS